MLSMINRGRIQDQATVQEFEHLIARLRGFLTQSFDENGDLIVADPNLAIFSVGDYKPSANTADHAGWLLCDGRQVSRQTYQSLYNLIGTDYGVGDGSTTFNIPNLQGRFLLGKAVSGTGSTMAATGGSIDHVHTGPSHTHTGPSHTHTGPSHTHSISSVGAHTHTGAADSDGSHTHSVSGTTDDGSGSAAGATSGTDIFPSLSNHTHAYSTTTGSGGSHTHSLSINDAGAHDHTGSTGASGTGDTGASGTGDTGASGTGNTGTANPPFLVGNFFIFTGVA